MSTRTCSPSASSTSAPRIDSGVANALIAQLLHLEADNPDQEIKLYINCEGGDLSAMLAIYDTMQFIRSPVATTCVGRGGRRWCRAARRGRGRATVGAPARPHRAAPAGAQGRGTIPDLILQADELVRMRAESRTCSPGTPARPWRRLRRDTDRDRVFTAAAALRLRADRQRDRRAMTAEDVRPAGSVGASGQAARAKTAGGPRPAGLNRRMRRDQVDGDVERQVDQGRCPVLRYGSDDFARRILEAPLDLGEVLRGHAGAAPRCRSTSRHAGAEGHADSRRACVATGLTGLPPVRSCLGRGRLVEQSLCPRTTRGIGHRWIVGRRPGRSTGFCSQQRRVHPMAGHILRGHNSGHDRATADEAVVASCATCGCVRLTSCWRR